MDVNASHTHHLQHPIVDTCMLVCVHVIGVLLRSIMGTPLAVSPLQCLLKICLNSKDYQAYAHIAGPQNPG